MKRRLSEKVWKTGICFYLDLPTNIILTIKAAVPKAWLGERQMKDWQLSAQRKEAMKAQEVRGSFCVQYKGNINGEKFADCIRDNFKDALEKGANPR